MIFDAIKTHALGPKKQTKLLMVILSIRRLLDWLSRV